jgi:prepilin-type N-terminal cleavage/methylation domain-containing protein
MNCNYLCPKKNRISKGFTLLEVLIAITLTGLVMGSLFALQSQNKKLTIHSLDALDRISEERAIINSAWIGLDINDNKNYQLDNIRFVETPETLEKQAVKIKTLKYKLESVDIKGTSQEILFSTTRLVKD